jgi:pimeloyl-ACP methyl ester carboxylesterase
MTVLERMNQFAERYGKCVVCDGTNWRYYRLGAGPPVLWLTGGLRRSALAFAFLERLATHHTVIAPDYPPVRTIAGFMVAIDAIRHAEGVGVVALAGQSYGGLLAQAYLAHQPGAVERLILSSSGPADYGRAWLPVEYAAIALVRLLPVATVKRLLARGLLRVISVPEAERAEWRQAVTTVLHDELSREDVVSHFAVAADLIREGSVTPGAYRNWTGRIVVLSSEDDPTQSARDIPHYEQLFGRAVDVIAMGKLGHTALLSDPDRYTSLVEQALACQDGARLGAAAG